MSVRKISHAISVYDLEAIRAHNFKHIERVGRIQVGDAPVSILFSPDGRWLYSTSEVAEKSWGWPKEADGRPQGAIVVADLSKAQMAATDAVVARIPAGSQPVRMSMSPDGSKIYVSARANNTLLVFDSEKTSGTDPSHARIATVPVGVAPVPVAVVANGRYAFVGNSNRFGVDAASPSTRSR